MKELQKKNSVGGPAGVKRKKIRNGSNPVTTTAGNCHPPEDAPKDLAVFSAPPSTNDMSLSNVLSPGAAPYMSL